MSATPSAEAVRQLYLRYKLTADAARSYFDNGFSVAVSYTHLDVYKRQIQFYAARRKLTGEFPDGKVDMKKLSDCLLYTSRCV